MNFQEQQKQEKLINELVMRKRYESFLKSVIRSGETLEDYKTFEWFCEQFKEL